MPEKPNLAVHTEAATSAFAQMIGTLSDMKPVFRAFHAYHAQRIDAVSRSLDRDAPVRTLNAPDLRASALPHLSSVERSRLYGPRLSTRRTPPRHLGEMAVPRGGQERPRVGGRSRLPHARLPEAGPRPSAASGLLEITAGQMTYGPLDDPSRKRPWFSVTQADADRLMDLTSKALGENVKAAGLGSFGGGEGA